MKQRHTRSIEAMAGHKPDLFLTTSISIHINENNSNALKSFDNAKKCKLTKSQCATTF